jgi:hypothetical protein
MDFNRLIKAFPFLCALLALSSRANAQDCPADCIATLEECENVHPLAPGSHYLSHGRLPSTCPATCMITRQNCMNGLMICAPTTADCAAMNTSGGGGQSTPTPGPTDPPGPARNPRRPRTPSRPRDVPPDICEVGSESDPDNIGSCRCVEGAIGGTLPIYQMGQTHRVSRLQVRDREGRLHVMCIVPAPAPQPTDNGLDCGQLQVCGTACRDLNNDPSNCGGCDHACQRGELCSQGACVARETAPPTPPLPTTPAEAGQHLGRQLEEQVITLGQRTRVRPGLLLGASLTWTALPTESFMLPSPVAGISVTFDRFDMRGRGLIQLWFVAGAAWTGHVCPAAHLEGGVRFGYAVDDRRLFTPFLGWAMSGDTVPCHPPSGGIEVADGVHYATGPELGFTLRLYEGLHVNAGLRWNPFSRFTVNFLPENDHQGVSHVTANVHVEYRFDL